MIEPHDGLSTRTRWVAALTLAVSCLVLVSIGIVPGILDTDRAMKDLKTFYAAGQCLLDNESPYNTAAFEAHYAELSDRPAPIFKHPPQFATVCMMFASVPFEWARLISIILNLAGLAAVALVVYRTCLDGAHLANRTIAMIACVIAVAFVLAYPGTGRLIELGQMSMVGGGLALLSWHLERRGGRYQWLAGLALGIAAFKPEFAIIPLTWMVLEWQWRAVGTAVVVAVIMTAPAVIALDSLSAINDWLALISSPQSGTAGTHHPGFYLIMGVPSLLASFEVPVPNIAILTLASAPMTIVVWSLRRGFVDSDILGILFGLQFTLLHAKYAELGLLAPLLAGLLLHGAWSRARWTLILLGAAAMCIPAILFHDMKVPSVNHFKTLLALYGLVVLMTWSVGQAERMRRAIPAKPS